MASPLWEPRPGRSTHAKVSPNLGFRPLGGRRHAGGRHEIASCSELSDHLRARNPLVVRRHGRRGGRSMVAPRCTHVRLSARAPPPSRTARCCSKARLPRLEWCPSRPAQGRVAGRHAVAGANAGCENDLSRYYAANSPQIPLSYTRGFGRVADLAGRGRPRSLSEYARPLGAPGRGGMAVRPAPRRRGPVAGSPGHRTGRNGGLQKFRGRIARTCLPGCGFFHATTRAIAEESVTEAQTAHPPPLCARGRTCHLHTRASSRVGRPRRPRLAVVGAGGTRRPPGASAPVARRRFATARARAGGRARAHPYGGAPRGWR